MVVSGKQMQQGSFYFQTKKPDVWDQDTYTLNTPIKLAYRLKNLMLCYVEIKSIIATSECIRSFQIY